ncbi:CPBP family intramembrane glutamic endopeptidase [Chloroflexota bacterium]
MKNLSARNALFISLSFIILMWIMKLIHNIFFIDTILEWARSMQTYSFYGLAYGVFTVILITLLLRISNERYKDIGFNKQNLVKQIGTGFLFGLIIFIIMNLVINTIVDALLPEKSAEGADLSVLFQSLMYLPVWIVLAIFKSGFSEELFRIFTLTRFEKMFGKSGLLIALIVGSVIFGFGHYYQGVGGIIGATIRGLLYALVYLRKRRSFEAVSAHAVFNLLNISFGYVLY